MGIQNNAVAKRAYTAAPATLQSAAVSLLGLRIRRQRYGRAFERFSEEFVRRQWNDEDDWIKHQNRKLKKTLDLAKETTNHYADLPEIDTDPAAPPAEQIRDLPFLFDDSIRADPESLVSSRVDVDDCIALSTSGTTGTPKTTYHDVDSHCQYWAALERFYRRGGCRYGDRRLSFTGNKIVPMDQEGGPFGRYDRANNRMLMSSYHLGEETVDQYLDEIEAFSPKFIDGYPSSISYCAQRAIETDRDIRIPACFPTAESLRSEDRAIIERGFSTQVYDQYGSTESAGMITECPCGTLHVNPDVGIVELLDEDGDPVSDGEIGELVLTSLNNRAMPLIRYRIGDLARGPLRYELCACGWTTPVVEEIVGRQDEVVITADGRRIPMLSYNVFKYADHIEESQIVQETVDEFTLRIVPADGYTDEQAEIARRKLMDRVGEDVSVEIELLDEIPKTSSGKFRAVISKV